MQFDCLIVTTANCVIAEPHGYWNAIFRRQIQSRSDDGWVVNAAMMESVVDAAIVDGVVDAAIVDGVVDAAIVDGVVDAAIVDGAVQSMQDW